MFDDSEDSGRLELMKDADLILDFSFQSDSAKIELVLCYSHQFTEQFLGFARQLTAVLGGKDFISADIPFLPEVRSMYEYNIKVADETNGGELYIMEYAVRILRKSQSFLFQSANFINTPACSFLSEPNEREKISRAVKYLDENIGTIISIKSLSRIAAINECYLKKGFKVMTGKTILEYQNEKRMERAREFLHSGQYSVSQVAAALGFSSISHFSTAFKKFSGLKPCELIM